ncbi:hypothetical protein [Francisella tularensis]|nr:hypothetical protein [Francisella tularensis]
MSPELTIPRSGKIIRRILRKISAKEFVHFGDNATLVNPDLV